MKEMIYMKVNKLILVLILFGTVESFAVQSLPDSYRIESHLIEGRSGTPSSRTETNKQEYTEQELENDIRQCLEDSSSSRIWSGKVDSLFRGKYLGKKVDGATINSHGCSQAIYRRPRAIRTIRLELVKSIKQINVPLLGPLSFAKCYESRNYSRDLNINRRMAVLRFERTLDKKERLTSTFWISAGISCVAALASASYGLYKLLKTNK